MRTSYPMLGVIGGSLLASASAAQTSSTPAPPVACPAPTTPTPATGQTEPANIAQIVCDLPENMSLFDFTYGEPGSPVLPLVGVQSDQIARVESIRRFGLSLLTGLGTNENAPAIGIDLSPFWLLAPGAISLEDYRGFNGFERVLARTKVAAAASRGNEANAVPSSLVFSLSSKLLSNQDPLMDTSFERCVTQDPGTLRTLAERARAAGREASSQVQDGDEAERIEREVTARTMEMLRPQFAEAYQDCANRLATRLSRRPSFDIGAGFRLTGAPGRFRDLQGSGFILWGTYATGVFGGDTQGTGAFSRALGMQVRGVVHGRYTFSEDVFDQEGIRTGQADSLLLVGGLESVPVENRPETLRWSLQAGWTRQDAPDATSEERNYWRFLGLARIRINEGLWLNGTVGRVEGRGVESDTYLSIGISIAPAPGASGIDGFYRRTR